MSTIYTSRLSLRPLTKVSQRNLAWLRDPEIVRYSEQRHREHTLSSQLRYINSFSGNSHLWAIIEVESGQHIGNLSATHDEANNVSDVAILIGETGYWGKGYGAEAWKAACNWLLDKDGGGVRKLEAGCAATNLAMKRIIERSGFQLEGERRLHFILDDGAPVGSLLYGRMR